MNWFGADNGFWDSIAAFRPGRSAETQRRVADMRGWARDLAERATKQSRAEAADTFSTSLAIRDLADAIDR